jgi:hypothetical protein
MLASKQLAQTRVKSTQKASRNSKKMPEYHLNPQRKKTTAITITTIITTTTTTDTQSQKHIHRQKTDPNLMIQTLVQPVDIAPRPTQCFQWMKHSKSSHKKHPNRQL